MRNVSQATTTWSMAGLLALGLSALCLLLMAGPAGAQGRTDYLNVESPPVKPITVTTVGNNQFVLVANTPNSSLDVFAIPDSATPALTLVASVPTGQEPVTVAVKPTAAVDGSRYVYTCNWLGDSLSLIKLTPQGGSLTASLERTVYTGDEPMHLTFLPQLPAPYDALTRPGGVLHEYLLVVFGQQGTWGWFDPFTLAAPSAATAQINLFDANVQQALQAGQVIGFTPASSTTNLPNWLLVLNRRGGTAPGTARGSLDGVNYDFDLWAAADPIAAATNFGIASLPPIGGFGTSNLNMAIASNGDIFVVGLKARNRDVAINTAGTGESQHKAMVTGGTGFTPSFLWRLRAGQPIANLDLNTPGIVPIPFDDKVTYPTDVVVYEPPGNGPTRVFVTGSSSDTVADITPGNGAPVGWPMRRIRVGDPGSPFGTIPPATTSGVMRGPRGLALRISPTSRARDVLLIYNFIEHSLTTVAINAANPTVSGALQLKDPRPTYITQGRKFGHSSKLSATNTASCTSCHIDFHTDQLEWVLSDGFTIFPPFPLPGVLFPLAPGNPGEKGPMVTQTFRGLVNFELQDQFMQDLMLSNKPYHWRGDRGIFDHFNSAFDGLMGIPNPSFIAPHPLNNLGIPAADMVAFRESINSIHYPPNPEMPKNRRYSGTPGGPNNPADGTLAQKGQKLFLIKDYGIDEVQPGPFTSCVMCHALPEGSDNILTETLGFTIPVPNPPPPQSLETVALRGTIEKEKRLFLRDASFNLIPSTGPSPIITGDSGLIHTGATSVGPFGSESIRAFVNAFAAANTMQLPAHILNADVAPITMFVREMDSGVSSSVGLVVTLTSSSSAADITNAFTAGELIAQESNSGLVVKARVGGQLYGFYYNPAITAGQDYIEVRPDPTVPNPAPLGNQNRTSLSNLLVGGNLLVLECVPLGDERRLGYVHAGNLQPEPALVPGAAALANMRPNTANRQIPLMSTGWAGAVAFVAGATVQSPHLATWAFQNALITDAGAVGGFGLGNTTRHDAPRRLRVSGGNIQHGAHLKITFPTPADFPVAHPRGMPPANAPGAGHPFLEVPIYPGRQGSAIWESAVELDPQHYLGIMSGASSDPTALTWMTQPVFAPLVYLAGTLDPILRNWVWVEVINQPGTPGQQTGPGSWQRLTI